MKHFPLSRIILLALFTFTLSSCNGGTAGTGGITVSDSKGEKSYVEYQVDSSESKLFGFVLDGNSAPLVNTAVTLLDKEGNPVGGTETNEFGEYTLPSDLSGASTVVIGDLESLDNNPARFDLEDLILDSAKVN